MIKLFRRKSDSDPWEVSPVEDYISLQREGYLYGFFENEAEAARNQEHPRISLSEYTKWSIDFYNHRTDQHYRYGQGFVNEVLPNWIADPQLFYTRSVQEAERIIYERYIKKD